MTREEIQLEALKDLAEATRTRESAQDAWRRAILWAIKPWADLSIREVAGYAGATEQRIAQIVREAQTD